MNTDLFLSSSLTGRQSKIEPTPGGSIDGEHDFVRVMRQNEGHAARDLLEPAGIVSKSEKEILLQKAAAPATNVADTTREGDDAAGTQSFRKDNPQSKIPGRTLEPATPPGGVDEPPIQIEVTENAKVHFASGAEMARNSEEPSQKADVASIEVNAHSRRVREDQTDEIIDPGGAVKNAPAVFEYPLLRLGHKVDVAISGINWASSVGPGFENPDEAKPGSSDIAGTSGALKGADWKDSLSMGEGRKDDSGLLESTPEIAHDELSEITQPRLFRSPDEMIWTQDYPNLKSAVTMAPSGSTSGGLSTELVNARHTVPASPRSGVDELQILPAALQGARVEHESAGGPKSLDQPATTQRRSEQSLPTGGMFVQNGTIVPRDQGAISAPGIHAMPDDISHSFSNPSAPASGPLGHEAAHPVKGQADTLVTIASTANDVFGKSSALPAAPEFAEAQSVGDPAAPSRDSTQRNTAAHRPTMSQSAFIARDIAQQLAVVARAAPGEVTELTLRPDELGQVRMRLHGTDGQIVLQVLSERPETQDLMRRHIEIVERAFRELGYSDITFDFGTSGHQADHGATETQTDPEGPQGEITAIPVREQSPTLTRAEGRLDIRL